MTLIDHGPDVEVLFQFNNTRKTPVKSGYRPDHLIKDNYLTCGAHYYYDDQIVYPGQDALGTVTFMDPNAYPECLWIGKVITFQEGAYIVGQITIIRILNPILEQNSKLHPCCSNADT